MLHTLLTMPLPAAEGRYVVPPIQTEVKALQQRANRDDLADWLALRPDWVLLDEQEMIKAFRAHLEAEGLPTRFWSPQRIRRELPFNDARTRDLWQRLRHESVTDMTTSEIKEHFGLVDPVRRLGRSLHHLLRFCDRIRVKNVSGVKKWTF